MEQINLTETAEINKLMHRKIADLTVMEFLLIMEAINRSDAAEILRGGLIVSATDFFSGENYSFETDSGMLKRMYHSIIRNNELRKCGAVYGGFNDDEDCYLNLMILKAFLEEPGHYIRGVGKQSECILSIMLTEFEQRPTCPPPIQQNPEH